MPTTPHYRRRTHLDMRGVVLSAGLTLNALVAVLSLDHITADDIEQKSQLTQPLKSPERGYAICMTNLGKYGCYAGGTDMSRAIAQNSSCSSLTSPLNQELKQSQTISVSSSPSTNTEPCPCKPQYSGSKCDNCADGFSLRLKHSASDIRKESVGSSKNSHQNAMVGGLDSTGINILRWRQSKLFECKFCDCDPIGSRSHICDKRSGSCFCLEGYRGIRCDQCAFGYYNQTSVLSNSSILTSAARPKQRHCIDCGDCFDYWRIVISNLKESSVELIKRTSELSQFMISGAKVPYDTAELPSDTSLTNGSISGVNFSELDAKMSIVGEMVLMNKRESDRLIMLTEELSSTIRFFNETSLEVLNQEARNKKFWFDFYRLNYELEAQDIVISKLSKIIETGYRKEQLNIQELIPLGAAKLIAINRDRSLHYFAQSLDVKQKFNLDYNRTVRELESTVQSIESSRKLLASIGRDYLNGLMNAHNSTITSSDDHMKPLGDYLPGSGESHNSGLVLLSERVDLAHSLIVNLAPMVQFEHSELPAKKIEIKSSESLVGDAKLILSDVESDLDKFDKNLRAVMSIVSSTNEPNSHDIAQMVRTRTGSVRLSLNKVDAKLTAARSELAELLSTPISSSFGSSQLQELSQEINKTFELHSPLLRSLNVEFGPEFEDLPSLKEKAKDLSMNMRHLNDELIKKDEIKRNADVAFDQIRALNTKTRATVLESSDLLAFEDETRWFNSTYISIIGNRSAAPADDPSTSSVELIGRRLLNLQIDSMKRRLAKERLVEIKTKEMDIVNAANREMLSQVDHQYHEVLVCLASMDGQRERVRASQILASANQINGYALGVKAAANDQEFTIYDNWTNVREPVPIDEHSGGGIKLNLNTMDTSRAKKASASRVSALSHQKRIADFIAEFQLLMRQLSWSHNETKGLSYTFNTNEQQIKRQKLTLHLLHHELDQITSDLVRRLNSFQECQANN